MIQLIQRDTAFQRGGLATKAQFQEAERKGLWNRFQVWPTLDRLIKSGYDGWLTIRSTVRDSPFFVPQVVPGMVDQVVAELEGRGARQETMYFQEIPNPNTVRRHINFEVMRNEQFYWVTYGTGQGNLRHDLEQNGLHVIGARAMMTLRHFLGPDCYDDLMDVLNLFPSEVIEATRFNQPVGTLGRELVLWEIRNY